MKRIILAATAVLLLSQPDLAYTRLFYRFTVRSNYVKMELPAPTPVLTDTPLPDPSTIPPAEEGLSDEDGLVDEPGVENTPEGEEIVSAIIGPFDDVELIEPSTPPPSTPSTQLSTSPAEEESVRVEEDLVDEPGVVITPEEEKEEEQSVEMPQKK